MTSITHFKNLSAEEGFYVGAKGQERLVVGMGLSEPGNQFFVDSGTGADSNNGKGWASALATLDAAFAKCTANNGDIIWVAPGHSETYSTTGTKITADVAGVRVIGVGFGADRPTFTFSHTGATMAITANSVVFDNLLFVTGVDSVTTIATISGNDCMMGHPDGYGVEVRDTTDVEVIDAFKVTGDRFKANVYHHGYTSGNANLTTFSMNGVADAEIYVVALGKAGTGVVNFVTAASTNVMIKGIFLVTGTTDLSKNVVATIGSNTWKAEGFDIGAGYEFSGGSGAALTGIDMSAVSTKVDSVGTLAGSAATGTQATSVGTLVTSVGTVAGSGASTTNVSSVGTLVTSVGTQAGSVGTQAGSVGTLVTSVGTQTSSVGTQSASVGTLVSTASSKADSVGAQATSIGTQAGSVGTQVGSVGTQTGSVGTLVSTANSKVDSVGAQATSIGTQAGSVGTQTGSVGTLVSTANSKADSVGTQVGSVGTQTGSVGTLVSTANSKADSVGTQAGSVGTQTGSVGTLVSTANSKVDSVGTQTGSVGTLVSTANSKVDSVGTQAGSVGTQTGSVGTQTGSVGTLVSTANSKVDSVGTQTGSVGTLVGSVGTQVSTADSRLTLGLANLGGNLVRKTITHTGSASYTAFTVTGCVAAKVVGYITTALTNHADTTSVGTATSAAGLIAATAGTAMQTVNQVWVDNAPTKFETFPSDFSIIGDGEDITVDGSVNLVGGVVELYCIYIPLSSDGAVAAAA